MLPPKLPSTNHALAADPSGLHQLRQTARAGDQAGLEAAARAFEALLVGQMLKQMRAASSSISSGMFDSPQTELYQDLQDQEMARVTSEQGEGLGIRQALMRQLGGSVGSETAASARQLKMPERNSSLRPMRRLELSPDANSGANQTSATRRVSTGQPPPPIQAGDWPPRTNADFVRVLLPQAEAAGEKLGMDPMILLAQSALETGWGRHVPRRGDGRSSYNLFGIKADRRWEGDYVSVGTLEFRGGAARREQARFRAYDSPADSFIDYVNFLQVNPRYRTALTSNNSQEFVRGLQRAGYATDPSYAAKILGIYDQMHSLLAKSSQAPGPVAMTPNKQPTG
ncbi:flagellar assembly peptidoglycan hydrolase FlgJ [Rhodoferax sp. 4810]|uniref:Peptidoglycan hydrolase FlgJ n=1 Tax=Thiospirillum jenense TaxID=1653858 RepID=A0A839HB49_9GAMM|nr:flagellar assembly peptidoglycan hydrolase FlgJ [Thiospirillum jenense]MBB1073948.1 flagellar assembly peptidoglycan hydrolase FlgJ [Rhodoferax jenense]MBB1125824.1 flagellar assembly peptidoglycan hydrolase FlgJ [Thiospirillum jenense]